MIFDMTNDFKTIPIKIPTQKIMQCRGSGSVKKDFSQIPNIWAMLYNLGTVYG